MIFFLSLSTSQFIIFQSGQHTRPLLSSSCVSISSNYNYFFIISYTFSFSVLNPITYSQICACVNVCSLPDSHMYIQYIYIYIIHTYYRQLKFSSFDRLGLAQLIIYVYVFNHECGKVACFYNELLLSLSYICMSMYTYVTMRTNGRIAWAIYKITMRPIYGCGQKINKKSTYNTIIRKCRYCRRRVGGGGGRDMCN